MDYNRMACELMVLVENDDVSTFVQKTKQRILPRGQEILGSEPLTTCLFAGSHPLLSPKIPIIIIADDESQMVSYAVLVQRTTDGVEQCQLHLSNGDALELDGDIGASDLVRLMAGLSSKTRLFDFRVSLFRDDSFTLPSKLYKRDVDLNQSFEKLAVDWPLDEGKGMCFCDCWAFCSKSLSDKGDRARCSTFTAKCHGYCNGTPNC